MSAPNTKLMIPDRAIASVVFSFLSLFTFSVYCQILWGTHDKTDDGMATVGSILGSLETTRRVLAVVALLWCVWSWRKEWWLPSVIATICTLLALWESFFIDS
jgi:hypothetical protein